LEVGNIIIPCCSHQKPTKRKVVCFLMTNPNITNYKYHMVLRVGELGFMVLNIHNISPWTIVKGMYDSRIYYQTPRLETPLQGDVGRMFLVSLACVMHATKCSPKESCTLTFDGCSNIGKFWSNYFYHMESSGF
jgi:hypothetical protein